MSITRCILLRLYLHIQIAKNCYLHTLIGGWYTFDKQAVQVLYVEINEILERFKFRMDSIFQSLFSLDLLIVDAINLFCN